MKKVSLFGLGASLLGTLVAPPCLAADGKTADYTAVDGKTI